MEKETEKKFTDALIEYAKGFVEWQYAMPCAKEGVRLFLDSIWHDASEEQPNPQKLTLGIFKDRTWPVVGYNSFYDENAMWCYLDDILPESK